MKLRGPFFAVCCFTATALLLGLSACESADSRAQQAFTNYQAASAAGDLDAARIALIEAVAARDDEPTFWQELGKVQLELGAYSDAYYAFTRAHELDRTNVDIVATLAQLALLSENIDVAEDHARRLELLAPNHPAVKLVRGYVALRHEDLDEADRNADELLRAFPFDPGSRLLKARIFLARGDSGKAIGQLEEQLRARPDDVGTLRALLSLHEHENNWSEVASIASRLRQINPKDRESALLVVDASFRANDLAGAKRASELLLAPDAAPDAVESVLRIWAERWKSPDAIAEVRRHASSAGPGQQLAYASYFNETGSPQDSVRLIGERPQMPIGVQNMSRNAIIADTLARMGRTGEAEQIFDAILAKEADHLYALRGRINLKIRTGRAKAAVSDAQRLVSVAPRSARDRLLLAQAYSAAGDRRQLDRTLWDAFHEIPANRDLYNALRAHVARSGGTDAVKGVDVEFAQQRDVRLAREFI